MNKYIIYIGFETTFNLNNDDIYINNFKNNNNIKIELLDDNNIIEDKLKNSDIIICGSFLNNIDIIKLICNYKYKIIFHVYKPIKYTNNIMNILWKTKFIPLTYGCITENTFENQYNIKYSKILI